MAHYFASDVHLRDDRPDRAGRFREWLEGLAPSDSLTILGDLCDFWMAARTSQRRLAEDPSLRALADLRQRGGSLAIMAGNHDRWLCPFYARCLGAEIIEEPHDRVVHGLRLRMVHGHLLGARRRWKAFMEGRAFFHAFGRLPGPVARRLDRALTRRNERGLLDDEERHLKVFRNYARSCRDLADLVVIGHVHRPVDEAAEAPRLIVLGGWQRRGSFLKIDETGASFHEIAPRPAGDGIAAECAADPAGERPPQQTQTARGRTG